MSLVLDLKVVPQSGRAAFCLDKKGGLKCYLKSAPEGGKANEELVKLLAKALKIPQTHITILLGATSRTKRIKIETTLTQQELFDALGIARQTAFL